MLRVFITSCPYLLLKAALAKLFGKVLKMLGRIAFFYPYQVTFFEFYKIFINSCFSEHRHGFLFAMVYCLQKETARKKKFLAAISFENFFSIASLHHN